MGIGETFPQNFRFLTHDKEQRASNQSWNVSTDKKQNFTKNILVSFLTLFLINNLTMNIYTV